MSQTPLEKLTDQELLAMVKQSKLTDTINALLIGVLIGILIYSVVVNTWGFLTIILLFGIYKLSNRSTYRKADLEAQLKSRGLK